MSKSSAPKNYNSKNYNSNDLRQIRELISSLHGEVTSLEKNYAHVLTTLRRFEEQADTDDLTGLHRRQAFLERFQNLLGECQQKGHGCGLLVIDIDHFKKINDTHGHPTGDEVIKQIAELLKRYESTHVSVGRIGGEEFAVAARGTPAEILGLAEFIRRGAERLHGAAIGPNGEPSSTVQWKCTLSVGVAQVATHTPERRSGEELIREALAQADQALYQAKQKGRNRVCAA